MTNVTGHVYEPHASGRTKFDWRRLLTTNVPPYSTQVHFVSRACGCVHVCVYGSLCTIAAPCDRDLCGKRCSPILSNYWVRCKGREGKPSVSLTALLCNLWVWSNRLWWFRIQTHDDDDDDDDDDHDDAPSLTPSSLLSSSSSSSSGSEWL